MKKIIGLTLLGISLIGALANYYLIDDKTYLEKLLSFITTLLFIVGLLLLFLSIPLKKIKKFVGDYIYDPQTWKTNATPEELVFSLRNRALLFNNIAIAIFIVIVLVILTGFCLLVYPTPQQVTDSKVVLPISLTIRISSSVLLIFLVGILFRVFKYLLRVAAFYNSKADALEYFKINSNIPFEKLIEVFTPEKYDISELDQSSIATNIVDLIKAKLGR